MRRRQTIAAGFAVVLFVVGQLVAFQHEAAERHVTCDEHGEQVDAPTLGDKVDNCGQAHWIGVEGSDGDHEDCAIARLLRTSTQTSHLSHIHVVASVLTELVAPAPIAGAASVDVLRIAPKTSPPRLS